MVRLDPSLWRGIINTKDEQRTHGQIIGQLKLYPTSKEYLHLYFRFTILLRLSI